MEEIRAISKSLLVISVWISEYIANGQKHSILIYKDANIYVPLSMCVCMYVHVYLYIYM